MISYVRVTLQEIYIFCEHFYPKTEYSLKMFEVIFHISNILINGSKINYHTIYIQHKTKNTAAVQYVLVIFVSYNKPSTNSLQSIAEQVQVEDDKRQVGLAPVQQRSSPFVKLRGG